MQDLKLTRVNKRYLSGGVQESIKPEERIKMCLEMKWQIVSSMVFLICLSSFAIQSARAWPAFDALDASRSLSDYFQPPPSPFMQNFHYSSNQPPINLPPFANAPQHQLLTPASSSGEQFQGPSYQLTAQPASSVAQQEFSSAAQSESSHQADQPHQLGPRDVPQHQPQEVAASSTTTTSTTTSTTRTPVSSLSATIPELSSVERDNLKLLKPSEHDEPIGQAPSPFGKILDAVLQSTTTNRSNQELTSNKVEPASHSVVGSQTLLKPRKSEPRKQTPASLEQQIIDQHARAAAGYNSHTSQYATQLAGASTPTSSTTTGSPPQQRLLPNTRNRGDHSSYSSSGNNDNNNNKLLGSLLLNSLGVLTGSSGAESSASGGEQPTSISNLLNNFKSGISSRSSIMKAAISDNKLARTLTSVSKSMASNKYIASAGIAAALAALGLTVGKFLTPNYSGQYNSKLGEPLMSSSSFMAPSYFNSALFAAGNDRNFATPTSSNFPFVGNSNQPFESLMSSPSNQFVNSASYNQASELPASSSDYEQALAMSQLSSNLYQQQAAPAQMAQFYGPMGGYNYLRPVLQTQLPLNKQIDRQRNPFDAANGHYSSFYNQADTNREMQPPSMSDQGPTIEENLNVPTVRQSQQQYGTYISGAPSTSSAGNLDSGQDSSEATNQQASFADQLMPSASLESPIYRKAPTHKPMQTPRRSGAVTLKLDESKRSRLAQQINSGTTLNARPLSYLNYNYLLLDGQPNRNQAQASTAAPARAQQLTLLPMTNQKPQWSTVNQQQQPTLSRSTRSQANSRQQQQFGALASQANEEGQLRAPLQVATNSIVTQQQELKFAPVKQAQTSTYQLIRHSTSTGSNVDAKQSGGWKLIDQQTVNAISPLNSKSTDEIIMARPEMGDKQASKQLEQMATLINQQRASIKGAVANNEVVASLRETTNSKAKASKQNNSDEDEEQAASKSANSEDETVTRMTQHEENEQQDNRQSQQQATGDNVVVELIDGPLEEASIKQTAPTTSSVGQQQRVSQTSVTRVNGDDNNNNKEDEVSKSYRGLVAGSLSQSASN